MAGTRLLVGEHVSIKTYLRERMYAMREQYILHRDPHLAVREDECRLALEALEEMDLADKLYRRAKQREYQAKKRLQQQEKSK